MLTWCLMTTGEESQNFSLPTSVHHDIWILCLDYIIVILVFKRCIKPLKLM